MHCLGAPIMAVHDLSLVSLISPKIEDLHGAYPRNISAPSIWACLLNMPSNADRRYTRVSTKKHARTKQPPKSVAQDGFAGLWVSTPRWFSSPGSWSVCSTTATLPLQAIKVSKQQGTRAVQYRVDQQSAHTTQV